MHVFPVALAIAPVLLIALSTSARNWTVDRIGWGVIPVLAWFACAALILRYKGLKDKKIWRSLGGAGVLIAVSIALLSMFHASDGRLDDASLGGHWGEYLGGSPWPLGWVKVALLLLVGPVLLFPKSATRVYWTELRSSYSYIGGRLQGILGKQKEEIQGGGEDAEPSSTPPAKGNVVRRAHVVSKKYWRSAFGVPSTRTKAISPAIDLPTQSEEEPQPEVVVLPAIPEKPKAKGSAWHLPSLEILNKGENAPVPQAVLNKMAHHIETTLADHRVDVKVEDIRTGPRVVRFGLVPGWVKRQNEAQRGRLSGPAPAGPDLSRVRVQSILAREKDLALALKTPYLRMEAPVPGEALVGLEVPNPHPRRVFLRSVAESPVFQKLTAKGGLPVAIGEDTGGAPVVADLTDLPHLLIAGATGSGKSVCINSVIASLLLTTRPDRLRMIMVDPKRVELTPFNGIPNLILPVIVDTDQVLVVLRGIQSEMLRRYKLLEEVGVRNLAGYNKKAKEAMPFLVVIIDELADLMMSAAYEVEQSLVRLAQLGRATGIHLILATQRPSVNVVTGLLKANVPARIAFAVASQVDSRVILDSVGAEKLLGKGDMLLLSQDSPKPIRVQGTFVHDREIEKLVEFWSIQSGVPLPEISLDDPEDDESEEMEDDEDLMEKARELAERTPNISPSVLQRRLQIGYTKAVQLARQLEVEGIVPRSSTSSRPPW